MLFHPMDIFIFIALGISIWAQFRVKGNFNKWAEVSTKTRMSGAEVARKILDDNGLQAVSIEVVPGKLSDHYDPMNRVIRLSEEVYYGCSIASVSVASHEVGHAIQHQQSYKALVVRHKIFPLAKLSFRYRSIYVFRRNAFTAAFVNWSRNFILLCCSSISIDYIACRI